MLIIQSGSTVVYIHHVNTCTNTQHLNTRKKQGPAIHIKTYATDPNCENQHDYYNINMASPNE